MQSPRSPPYRPAVRDFVPEPPGPFAVEVGLVEVALSGLSSCQSARQREFAEQVGLVGSGVAKEYAMGLPIVCQRRTGLDH